MNDKPRIIEPKGFIYAGASLALSMGLFYSDAGAFWYSLTAAMMTAGIVWCTYIVLRWIYLAIKE